MPARAPEGCRGCPPGPEARTGGEALSARGRGARGRGTDVPRVGARWAPGPRAGRPSAQVTFVSATHCSSPRARAGWAVRERERHCSSRETGRSPGAQRGLHGAGGRGGEKVVRTPGTATLLLVAHGWCCRPPGSAKTFPREATARNVEARQD